MPPHKNKALNDIVAEYRAYVMRTGQSPAGHIIHIDRETEAELEKVGGLDVGTRLARHVQKEGVRSAFPKIFGMVPKWDKPKLEIL
jgi:hypothetical protein